MPYQNSWYSRIIEGTKETLKNTATTLETTIKWLMPFGIKKQFLNINIRNIGFQAGQQNQVYWPIDGLERKMQKLESNRDAHATNYGLIRTFLAGIIAPSVIIIYHGPATFNKEAYFQEHALCYLSTLILAYTAGTILGKIRKTQFENKTKEDLESTIKNYKTIKNKDDDDELLTQEYKPQEFELIPKPEETKPATKPRTITYDETKPKVTGTLKFDFETFYKQYCAEFQPENKGPPNIS
ncbi:hypothetical protein HY484_02000 [Candidatus Woesearchaeota archaeon]|nr:hypothetical protein [Candidatus Woesearchaeota archaeon]